MLVSELSSYGFEKKWIKKLENKGIKKLYRYQEELISKGYLDKNLILSAPTASGKTLIAMLKALKHLKKGKVVYLVPLISLGVEKYEEFKKFFEKEYSVALSVGDFDSTDPWLSEYDLIVATVEKMDSLIRHNASWINDINLVIVDEIHLLNDPQRGPTLELLLIKLKQILKKLNILGLSATIKNSYEIAEWLNCELYETNFRPVKIYYGVAYDSLVSFFDKENIKFEGEIEAEIVRDTLKKRKQILFFVSSRRRAESLAEKLSRVVMNFIGKNELFYLKKISNEIEHVLENPTKQCERLSLVVKRGVAFHHAGLLAKQKKIIEENFRKGLIKVIVATPTLAAGVNLPAFRVVIRDIKRYYKGLGSVYIPVIEYYQMAGRAGRPQYDNYGEAILVAKNEDEAYELTERYIFGEPEPIKSKLSSEPVLRSQILSLIASGFVKTERRLKEFFTKTFFAYQYGDISLLEEKIEGILDTLMDWKMIVEKDGKLEPTRLGKRTSELYLDPLTGYQFFSSLKKKVYTELSYLQLISYAIEMRPLPSLTTSDLLEIEALIMENKNKFLMEVPDEYELEYEDFLKSVKMAKVLLDWVNESTEEEILEKYKMTPGELHSRLQIADWLIYSLEEISRIINKKEHINKIKKLRVRLKYGVKEELLPLIRLEGIGRVRARKLFNSGLRTLEDLRKIPEESLSRIIGTRIARKIKLQLEGKSERKEKQKTLFGAAGI